MAKKSKRQAISVILSFVIIITSIFIPAQVYAATSKVSVKVSNAARTLQSADADNYITEAGSSFTVTFSRKGYSNNDCKISVTISSQDDIKYKINKNTVKITAPKSNNASVMIVRGEYDGKDYKNGAALVGVTILPTHNKIDVSKTYIKVPSPQKEMKIDVKALPLTEDIGHLDPYLITSASSNKSVAEVKMRGSFTEEYFAIVFNGAYGSTNITLRTPSGVSKTIKVIVGEETTKPPDKNTNSSSDRPSNNASNSKKPSKNTSSNNKQDKTNSINENEVTSVPSIIEDVSTPLSDVTDNPTEIPQAEIELQVPEFGIKKNKKGITVNYPEVSDVSGYAIYLSNNDQDYYLIYIGEEKEYSFSKIEKNKKYYVKMKTYKIIENDAKFSDFGQVKEFTY